MKKSVHLIACTIAFLGFYSCKNKAPDPELVTIDLLRGDVLLCGPGNFGEVSFRNPVPLRPRKILIWVLPCCIPLNTRKPKRPL